MEGIGRRQFLLSKNKAFDLNWPSVEVGEYTLFTHPEIEQTFVEYEGKAIHLVGEIFDWKTPQWTSKDILNYLVKQPNRESFLEALSQFMGHYVLIYKSPDDFFLLNDTCAQYEAYFSQNFSVIGSQVKLINRVLKSEPHVDADAIAFFESPDFKSKKIFVGDCTHVSNIRHLRPNHLIDLKKHKIERFFPTTERVQRNLEEAASLASKMISGYVAAIASRHQIAVAVTAGYDSRVLFLASLNRNAHYYISQHEGMPVSHYDIKIGQQLTDLLGRGKYHVIKDKEGVVSEGEYGLSIDFPRTMSRPSFDFENCVYLNGNCSEVARNYFGTLPFLNGNDLARMLGYLNTALAKRLCQEWFSGNEGKLKKLKYNVLDIFYWEEKMGNWGAKKRTETNAIGRIIYSPFNSRGLMEVLLSVNRKHRDSHNNKLYKAIIRSLEPKALQLPLNPTRKNKIIGALKKAGVYNGYRFFGIKSGFLRF